MRSIPIAIPMDVRSARKARQNDTRSALERVMPLRDPVGVVYGYIVRGHLNLLMGLYSSESEAIVVALRVEKQRAKP